MDTYGAGKLKEMTQNRRSTTTRKIVIGGADQLMPKYRNWATFLSDGDNKTELIQFIAGYCKTGNFRRKLKIPVRITCGEDTWLLDTVGVHQLPSCNHHETATRIIRHTVQFNDSNSAVVVASDTDILVLLIYAIYRLSLVNIPHRVQMKIDAEKLEDVNDICNNLPQKVRKLLPAYHSITRLDTTLYPFQVGKVKLFRKALKNDKTGLLQCFLK